MTNDHRGLLTEFLEECWHEWQYIKGPVCQELFTCRKCGEHCKGIASKEQRQRTFLADKDMMDCQRMLVKKGLWDEFYKTMIREYIVNVKDRHYDGEANMVAWLICPIDEKGEAHFCRLVAEFIDQDKK